MRLRYLLMSAVAFALSAQEQPAVQTQVYVTAVDVVVDVRDKAGKLPTGLTPKDFVVVEDGVERTVVGAQYLHRGAAPAAASGGEFTAAPDPASALPPWQLVLYFETELSSGSTRKVVAQELSRQADMLAAIGKVDVVLADPTPKALVRGSSDAAAIREALTKVANANGANQLAMHRRHFFEEMQGPSSLATMKAAVKSDDPFKSSNPHKPSMNLQPAGSPQTGNSTESPLNFDTSGATPTQVTSTSIRPWVQQEIQLISHFRANLAGWLATYRRQTPRTLLLVTDGFDVDPIEFYRPFLFNKSMDSAFENTARMTDSVGLTAKTLAAAGWTTISIPGDGNGDASWLDDASTSNVARIRDTTKNSTVFRNQVLRQPRQPLELIADVTGGSVVANSGKIAAAVASMDDRILVTYQVDRKPDGKPHQLQIKARNASLKVRSTQWASSATPEQMAETRATNLLQMDPGVSDFPLDAKVEWNPVAATRSGVMTVVAQLDSVRSLFPTGGRGNFRVTMAVQVPPNKAFTVKSVLPNYDVNQPTFHFRAPITIPADASAIALVIEETGSGLAGTARVTIQ
jgi:VWFA-related protein